jgi:DNA-binding beta-propeller fold protein YncE
VAVTPDSRHVLVAGHRSNAIAMLTREPEGLSQPEGVAGCIARLGAEGCTPGRALGGPVDIAITADGRGVYVASAISDGIAALRRDRTTGILTQSLSRRGCISQDGGGGRCARGRGLDEVWSVAVSPDARNVYAVSAKVNMLGAMARNRATGTPAQLPGRYGCFIRGRGGLLGCPEGRGLTVAVAVTVSPDGRNVYVASDDSYLGAVAVFRRIRG